MTNVEVRDAEGKLLHTYEMFADGYGTIVKDESLFEMAKMNAIDDDLVSEDKADTLTFKVAD